MFFKIIYYFILAFFATYAVSYSKELVEVDYNTSMGKECKESYNFHFREKDSEEKYKKFEEIYNKNIYSKIKPLNHPTIPKIIHQIWIGPKEMSSLSLFYQKEWKRMHPDWEYKLWRDEDVKNFDFETKHLYDDSQSYLERSDILRYEILKKYGGVYADMDVKPIIPQDNLIKYYDFYASLESPTDYQTSPIINNGFIAASPNNPIIIGALDEIKKNWKKVEARYNKNELNSFGSKSVLAIKRTMQPLTDSFLENYSKSERAIAFPGSYTMPSISTIYLSNNFFKKSYRRLFDNCKDGYSVDIKPETIVFHNLEKIQSFFFKLSYPKKYKKELPLEQKQILKHFRSIYNISSPEKINYNKKDSTPSIIHFILNENDDKQAFKDNLNAWKKAYPDWEIKTWFLENLDNLNFNKELVSKISNEDEKKNLVSLYILKQFGGVVISQSITPRKYLDELVNKYSFFSWLFPEEYYEGLVLINPSILASSKDNFVIEKSIGDIEKNWDERTKKYYDKKELGIYRVISPLTYNCYKFNLIAPLTIVFQPEFFKVF